MHDILKEVGVAHHDQPGSDRGGGVGDRRRVLPITIAVAAAVAAIAWLVYVGVVGLVDQATKAHFSVTPTVATRAWQPDPSYFCNAVRGELSQPQPPGSLVLATIVNTAPNTAAHDEAKTYYYNPTPANLTKLVASYSCKGGQS